MSQQPKVPLYKRVAVFAVLALATSVIVSGINWFSKQPPSTDYRTLCVDARGVYLSPRMASPICIQSSAIIDMTGW